MAKIFDRKFPEILKRALLQKPYDENSVVESVLDKTAERDPRPTTKLKRSFHQGSFHVNTSEFLMFLQKGVTYTT